MGLAIRHFLILSSGIKKISQKKYQSFYHNDLDGNVFPDYAGKIIDVADVVLELVNRKPYQIVRIDCPRYKVNDLGGIDTEYRQEKGRYIINFLDPPKVGKGEDILDASKVFEAKRLKEKYSWKLDNQTILDIGLILGL